MRCMGPPPAWPPLWAGNNFPSFPPSLLCVQFLFADSSDDAPLKAVDFGVSVFCRPGQYITQRAGGVGGAGS